jgi:hypothetical protein
MTFVLFWDSTQRTVGNSVQTFWDNLPGPIFEGQALQEYCLALEDEADTGTRNVRRELLFYTV